MWILYWRPHTNGGKQHRERMVSVALLRFCNSDNYITALRYHWSEEAGMGHGMPTVKGNKASKVERQLRVPAQYRVIGYTSPL